MDVTLLSQILGPWTSCILQDFVDIVTKQYAVTDHNCVIQFQKCLGTISNWSIVIRQHVMDQLIEKYPTLPKEYENTYYKCLRQLLCHLTSTYTIPVCTDFVYMYLVNVVADPRVQSMQIIYNTYEQNVLFSSVIRKTLIECIQFVTWPAMTQNQQVHKLTKPDKQEQVQVKAEKVEQVQVQAEKEEQKQDELQNPTKPPLIIAPLVQLMPLIVEEDDEELYDDMGNDTGTLILPPILQELFET
jgi:hypothetical protein